MGCDIHAYTEYYKDGAWHTGDIWESSPYREGLIVPSRFSIFNNRNYNFFAWLCGVRNGTWGEDIPRIADPKGLPEDSCEQIQQSASHWNGDGHSHSFYTLKELEKAWKKTHETPIYFKGAIDIRNPDEKTQAWLKLPEDVRGAPPHGYCAAGTYCIHVKWVEPLHQLIDSVYWRVQDFLWSLKWDKEVSDNEVRMVFWFDN